MKFKNLLSRFLHYVKIDTQSDCNSNTYPSTDNQKAFLMMLYDELRTMGITNVEMDSNSYVTAHIPANVDADIVPIGFIAHVDTSPDMAGKDVRPQIIENYDGSDIVLDEEKNIILATKEFPELNNYIQQTLITTSGNTLLGADDKAGVAEIMTMVEYVMEHNEMPHGDIWIAFTPDEEIGKGVDFFDISKFGAKYAYTVDGGQIGELEYENFNAAIAKIYVQGKSIHPGYAKNRMLNALQIAMDFNAMLPSAQRPEHTEGYEGFYHLIHCFGNVEQAELHYLIRDHDSIKFEEKKSYMLACVDLLNKRFDNQNTVSIDIDNQYRNMRIAVEQHYYIVEAAIKAMEQASITPLIHPIRGGTDGARLSFMGLPCPNLFTGAHNFHGRYEFVPLESMQKAVEVLLNIIGIFTKNSAKK
jgi:tripeptide aminopeptidase